MSFIRSSVLVVANIVASISLLSCDFIDDEKTTEPNRVTYPSFHQTYQQGDRNRYAFIAGSNPDILAGGLELTWETSFVPLTDPFTAGPTNLPLVKFSGTVTFGSGPTTATQYITQSTDAADEGSMLLHAFDNSLSPVDYWVADNPQLNPPVGNVQTIYSPYQVDAATSGEKGRIRNNNYKVMGNCTPTVCQEIASVIETFTVVDQPLQVITTPLGDFEAYRIIYDITITPTLSASPPLSSVLDFRTTCSDSDLAQPVSATGEMFVHPDIGPVRIRNTCTSGPIITTYEAILSFTNLPTN